jgi:hypothetical protein
MPKRIFCIDGTVVELPDEAVDEAARQTLIEPIGNANNPRNVMKTVLAWYDIDYLSPDTGESLVGVFPGSVLGENIHSEVYAKVAERLNDKSG